MTKQPIRTKLFTRATAELDSEIQKELKVPDPEHAVGVFIEGVEDEDSKGNDGDRSNGDNQ